MRRRAAPLLAPAIAVMLVLGGCSGPDTPATVDEPDVADRLGTVTDPTSSTATTGAPTSTTAAAVASPARLATSLDAEGYAAAFTSVERELRDPAVTGARATQLGEQLQLLYRSLADHPELDETVLAAVGDDVRPTVERVVRARQFLQARNAANPSTTPPSPTLPAWTIVAPPSTDELLALYTEAETLTGVPWYWLAAIHLQETRMSRIVGTSSAGAVGPMQFLPTTWSSCCTGDPTNTRDAIIGAATYLAQSGAPADMDAALHEYNPNDGYVAVVTAYAENLRDVPELYGGYHGFQVFTSSAAGTVRLPIGYSQPTPVDAAAYLVDHPDDAA
jgi:membrane-bound lytic murein transglycosylase B